MDINRIVLRPTAIVRPLALLAVMLVLANIVTQVARLTTAHDHLFGLVRLFSLDGEQTVPALFAVVLLFSAALLLTVIATLEKKRFAPDASKWAILAGGFMLMGMDESLSIHEAMIAPMRRMLGGEDLGIFYFAWVVPGIILVAALGLFFLRFLFRLPARTSVMFLIAATLYLGGAIGVELIEGWYRESHGNRNLTYQALVSLEEGLEMAGVIAFIHALLDYLAEHYQQVSFGFLSNEARAWGLVYALAPSDENSPAWAVRPAAPVVVVKLAESVDAHQEVSPSGS